MMGGRGSGGDFGNRSLRAEDFAQRNDAIQNALRARAKYYEYTDRLGKVHKGETGANTQGGTYRASYSEQVDRDVPTREVARLNKQLREIRSMGFDIQRISVGDIESVAYIKRKLFTKAF